MLWNGPAGGTLDKEPLFRSMTPIAGAFPGRSGETGPKQGIRA